MANTALPLTQRAQQLQAIEKACVGYSDCIGVALLIIGALGASSVVSSALMGWLAVSLPIGMAMMSCFGSCIRVRYDLGAKRSVVCKSAYLAITALALSVLGGLAMYNASGVTVLTAPVLGWGVIAPILSYVALGCCLNRCTNES